MKRKFYEQLLNWKNNNVLTPLMVIGARQVGKTYIINEFCQKEFDDYIYINLLDNKSIVSFFAEDIDTKEKIEKMKLYLNRQITENTVIFFDEIQESEQLISALKYFCENDFPYKIVCAGSLLGVKLNRFKSSFPVGKVRILKMYPMDFEEFSWALGEEKLIEYIKECFNGHKPLTTDLHRKALSLFREYMIVGGMPKSVEAYISKDIKNFKDADFEKQLILKLYRSDIMKIDGKYKAKVLTIFDQIPSLLSRHEKRVVFSKIEKQSTFEKYEETFFWLEDSMITNIAFNTSDPEVGLSLNEDRTYVKCYMGDTGLLLSHTFDENEEIAAELYRELFLGKLSINEGMFFENAIAQTLKTNGHRLFFYTHYDEQSKHNDIEIDFIISKGGKTKNKIFPIEVKSSEKYSLKSLLRFKEKYSRRIGGAYIIHPKNYKEEDGIIFLPCYMAFLI